MCFALGQQFPKTHAAHLRLDALMRWRELPIFENIEEFHGHSKHFSFVLIGPPALGIRFAKTFPPARA